MPYANISELPASVKDALPTAAQEVFIKAFNNAYNGGACSGDDACASKIGWHVVEQGWHKDDTGQWISKSYPVSRFSMYITKASHDEATDEYRWAATCSNTDKDLCDENMSTELFDDFISRIDDGEEAPMEIRSDFWNGGLPYLSVAHYMDLGGWATAGKATSIYRDGHYLKAKGTFAKNDVGMATYKAIKEDLKQKPLDPIRISIAFLDFLHSHGNVDWERKSLTDACPLCKAGYKSKVYKKGLLIHLATTRVPANMGTNIGLEVKSMITRRDDAESIVGKKLADKLEIESLLVGKSEASKDSALVIKAKADEFDSDSEAKTKQEAKDDGDVEEVNEKAASRKDITEADKKHAEKAYGNVDYADEENKKYPIDTEEHIRAAWNYINQEKNAAKYGDKGASVKSKIVAAWKKKIDKEGPPSAAENKSLVERDGTASDTIGMDGSIDAEIPIAMDYPFGGATSLKAVVDFLKKSGQEALVPSAYTHAEECANNILERADVLDKKTAMKNLMQEVKDAWEGEHKPMVGKSGVLDEALMELKAKVEEMSEQNVPVREKLEAIQPAFEALGETVKSVVQRVDAHPVPGEEDALFARIKELIDPLNAQVEELMKWKLAVSLPVKAPEDPAKFMSQATKDSNPPHRGILPPMQVKPPLVTTRKMDSIEALARRSVGLTD